jgi:hypothetical protein
MCPEKGVNTTAFVVKTGSEKQDIVNPHVFGPFADADAAWDWVEKHPRHIGDGCCEPIDGGYEGLIVVSEQNAEDPAVELAELAELEAEWS